MGLSDHKMPVTGTPWWNSCVALWYWQPNTSTRKPWLSDKIESLGSPSTDFFGRVISQIVAVSWLQHWRLPAVVLFDRSDDVSLSRLCARQCHTEDVWTETPTLHSIIGMALFLRMIFDAIEQTGTLILFGAHCCDMPWRCRLECTRWLWVIPTFEHLIRYSVFSLILILRNNNRQCCS